MKYLWFLTDVWLYLGNNTNMYTRLLRNANMKSRDRSNDVTADVLD